jgi:diacylglycerol kinase (ATP)
MQVTIIHNPTAGSGLVARESLELAVRAAGHDVAYHSTKSGDYRRGVQEAGDVLLVAGGDGTLRRVAVALCGRATPVALLPLGTANNFARSLGLEAGLEACMRRLTHGRAEALDLGVCSVGRGDGVFVEGAGIGLVPELIRIMDRYDRGRTTDVHGAAELRRACRVAKRVASLLPGFDCAFELDGEWQERRLLLLEAMNVQRIGPRLHVAPDADPRDGMLDVVWVEEAERRYLIETLQEWSTGGDARLESGFRRVQRATVRVSAARMHIDDALIGPRRAARGDVVLGCRPGALTMLL